MSFTEVLLILAIALVVLGPERLPGIARALGRGMREFRKATREIRATLEVEEVRRTIRQRIEDDDEAPREKPETERTGMGSVAWRDGGDDLAEKKRLVREARLRGQKVEAGAAPGDASEPERGADEAGSPVEQPEPTADLAESEGVEVSRVDGGEVRPNEASGRADGAKGGGASSD